MSITSLVGLSGLAYLSSFGNGIRLAFTKHLMKCGLVSSKGSFPYAGHWHMPLHTDHSQCCLFSIPRDWCPCSVTHAWPVHHILFQLVDGQKGKCPLSSNCHTPSPRLFCMYLWVSGVPVLWTWMAPLFCGSNTSRHNLDPADHQLCSAVSAASVLHDVVTWKPIPPCDSMLVVVCKISDH